MLNYNHINPALWAATLVINGGKTEADRLIDRVAKAEEKRRVYIKAMKTSPVSEIKEYNATIDKKRKMKAHNKKMRKMEYNI